VWCVCACVWVCVTSVIVQFEGMVWHIFYTVFFNVLSNLIV